MASTSKAWWKMNLVDDYKANKICIAGVCTLVGDHIPLFQCRHNDLGLGDLLLFMVSKSRGKTAGKVVNHLLYEGLHRGNIHYLELVERKAASLSVFFQLVENSQHCNIGLGAPYERRL